MQTFRWGLMRTDERRDRGWGMMREDAVSQRGGVNRKIMTGEGIIWRGAGTRFCIDADICYGWCPIPDFISLRIRFRGRVVVCSTDITYIHITYVFVVVEYASLLSYLSSCFSPLAQLHTHPDSPHCASHSQWYRLTKQTVRANPTKRQKRSAARVPLCTILTMVPHCTTVEVAQPNHTGAVIPLCSQTHCAQTTTGFCPALFLYSNCFVSNFSHCRLSMMKWSHFRRFSDPNAWLWSHASANCSSLNLYARESGTHRCGVCKWRRYCKKQSSQK